MKDLGIIYLSSCHPMPDFHSSVENKMRFKILALKPLKGHEKLKMETLLEGVCIRLT